MSLRTNAQNIMVDIDPSKEEENHIEIVPLEVYENVSCTPEQIEVSQPLEIEIIIEDLPGAPSGTLEPEETLEVEEEESSKDENDAKLVKENKWDWASKGPENFVLWIKERIECVPKHSGLDESGLDRAIAYLEKLDSEISKAMRLDLDGDLDANKIEEVRSKIDEGIERLEDRLDKINKNKKRKKKSSESYGIVKNAQRITGVKGVFVTVDLLTSGIARNCINGVVSAGHSLEHVFHEQAKKFKLTDREKIQVVWLLMDMGFPLNMDRAFALDKDYDTRSSDNIDFMAQYKS